MKNTEWFLLAIVALAFATGGAFYSHVPLTVASHWDASGNVNGYMSRGWGTFTLPIVFVIVFLVLFFIPRIDPKRDNIARFRKYFDYFIVGLAVILYYIYLLTLLWNIGYHFNFTEFLIPPIAALFYLIGVLLPHTEPNFMIGIRTPWTISSPAVWKKTHDAGGVAFKICGIIGLLGTALPELAVWLLFVPVAAATIGLVIYSYVLYEREKH